MGESVCDVCGHSIDLHVVNVIGRVICVANIGYMNRMTVTYNPGQCSCINYELTNSNQKRAGT